MDNYKQLRFHNISYDEQWCYLNKNPHKTYRVKNIIDLKTGLRRIGSFLWIWTAITNTNEKFFWVGDRTTKTLMEFYDLLPFCYESYSDGYKGYNAIPNKHYLDRKFKETNRNESVNATHRNYIYLLRRKCKGVCQSVKNLFGQLAMLYIKKDYLRMLGS